MTTTGPHHHTDLDEHDPLRALAHVPDTTVPPVEGVHRRAAAIRRGQRRTKVGVSAGVLASALIVGGVLIPQSDNDPRTPATLQAASFIGLARAHADTGSDCGVSYGVNVPRQQWVNDPRAARLMAWIPAGATGEPVRGVNVHTDGITCLPLAPAAALYTETPKQGLSLWAGVARPFRGEEGLQNVQVRGTTAELLPLPGNLMLSWTEPDGTRWVVQGSGLDQAAIVATLDALVLGGTSVDSTSVPAPWQQSPLPEATASYSDWTWSVEYGPSGYTQDPPGIRLGVGPLVEPIATGVARGADLYTFTRVNGHLAIFQADLGGCVRWDDAGLSYGVCGSQDMDRLVDLAEQAEKVAATDPRLQAAPDLFPTDDQTAGGSAG